MRKLLSTVAILVVILAGCLWATPADAGTVYIDAVHSGWYTEAGDSNGRFRSFNADTIPRGPIRNGWLGFDLSVLPGPVVSAVLEVDSEPRNHSGQMFFWREVTTDYGRLGTVGGPTDGIPIFVDLGDGTIFAQGLHLTDPPNVHRNRYDLTPAAIASINATSGFWAIGGSHDGDGGVDAFGYDSGVSGPNVQRLVLTIDMEPPPPPPTPIPEPASLAVWSTLAGIAWVARRRRRR